LDKKLKDVIEQTLINDESSTDQEMKEYFLTELQLPKDLADKCVAQRPLALGDLDFTLKLN
jgi:hypothetical protein